MKNKYLQFVNEATLPKHIADIAEELKRNKAVALGIGSHETMSHYDLLIAYDIAVFGTLNSVSLPRPYLWVSVLKQGAFAFSLEEKTTYHPKYVSEKLNMNEKSAEIVCLFLTALNKEFGKNLRF